MNICFALLLTQSILVASETASLSLDDCQSCKDLKQALSEKKAEKKRAIKNEEEKRKKLIAKHEEAYKEWNRMHTTQIQSAQDLYNGQIGKLERELKETKKQVTDLTNQLEECKNPLKEHGRESGKLQSPLEKKDTENKSLQEEISILQTKLHQAKQEVDNHQKIAELTAQQITVATNRLTAFQDSATANLDYLKSILKDLYTMYQPEDNNEDIANAKELSAVMEAIDKQMGALIQEFARLSQRKSGDTNQYKKICIGIGGSICFTAILFLYMRYSK